MRLPNSGHLMRSGNMLNSIPRSPTNTRFRFTCKLSRILKRQRNILLPTTTKLASFIFAPPLKRLSRSSVKRGVSKSDTAKIRKDLRSDDFWTPIKTGTLKDGTPFLEQSLINEIELYRSIILNPISHARTVTVVKKEVSEAMKAVKTLEAKLAAKQG